jgi:hypothetical protein
MPLPITTALLVASILLTVLFAWLGMRPRAPGRPRLAPWPMIMLFSGAFSLMMIIHLLTLLGLHPAS